MLYADANILLRFILKDNKEMAFKATEAIIAGEVFVLPEVFAEVVYVLNSVYGTERKDIYDYLLKLLKLFDTTDKEMLEKAFLYYGETKLDFVDCILAAFSSVRNKDILSFDKKLNNFIKRNREI